MYRYGENNLKTYGINKVEPRNFLCHTWIDGEKIAAGTDDGRWILVENGESKSEYNISAINEKSGAYQERYILTVSIFLMSTSEYFFGFITISALSITYVKILSALLVV